MLYFLVTYGYLMLNLFLRKKEEYISNHKKTFFLKTTKCPKHRGKIGWYVK